MFFFCPASLALWRASGFNYTPSTIGFGSFTEWWIAISKMITQTRGGIELSLAACVLWGIWKQRNSLVFEGIIEHPIETWKRIEAKHAEFVIANSSNRCSTENPVVDDVIGWRPPPEGAIKINCDASFDKRSKQAGIVAVARNHDGVVVGGTNERVQATNAFVAESLAIRLGSLMAEQHGWTETFIESDCKRAVEMMCGKIQRAWEVEAVVVDVQQAISLSNVTIKHVKRGCNRLADWLAKETLKGTCPVNWVSVMPQGLYELLNV